MSNRKPNLSPLQRRIAWLLENVYGGSRSAMARETGVALTGIVKVVTAQQDAGRKMLESIASNPAINPTWLLTGEGSPYRGAALPVANSCLPGPPSEHRDLLAEETVPEVAELYSPTRYWLKLDAGEWPLRSGDATSSDGTLPGDNNLAAGDLLLMETDSKRFPPVDRLHGRWCALPDRRPGKPPLLARLDYANAASESEPAHLEAETFAKLPPKVKRTTIDEYPGGHATVIRSEYVLESAGEVPASREGRRRPQLPPFPRAVQHSDLISVCVLLVRRF